MRYLISLALISLIACGAKWLSTVSGYNENDDIYGYAGILGRQIIGVKITGYKFRVHLKGKSSWEPETTGTGGDLITPIDSIAISGTTYKVYANGRWYPAVTGYNINDSNNGFAGVIGYPISGLMVKGASYSVAISDGSDSTTPINNVYQKFITTGTGLEGVSYQKYLPGMGQGCYFIGSCVIGGLGSDSQIMLARKWAVNNGYIRDSDTYTYPNFSELARKVSEYFGTALHSNWKLKEGCNHFWVINESGKEVFNSAGLGYSGC